MNCFGKSLIFSGDVGTKNSYTPASPEKPRQADFLVIESTYGDKLHQTTNPSDKLSEIIINNSIKRGGGLLIPSFAVGCAQELLVIIKNLKSSNKIPDIPVFLDSSMGVKATKIYCKYPEWHKLDYNQCTYFF